MSFLQRLFLCLLVILPGAGLSAERLAITTADPPATLRVWNRDIVTLRATIGGVTPQERADRAQARILSMPPTAESLDLGQEPTKIGTLEGRAILDRNALLFVLVPEDLDPTSSETVLHQVAHETVQNLRQALEARVEQTRTAILLHGIGYSLAATALLAAVLWLVIRARRLGLRLAAWLQQRLPSTLLGGGVARMLAVAESVLTRVLMFGVSGFALYAWLVFVLSEFPYTAPWSAKLGNYLLGLLTTFARGIIDAVPGLFTAALIFYIAQQVARAVGALLKRIEVGETSLIGLDRETAKATRWVALTLIWLFAMVVAYPYIPGSDSAAFKGVSVFAGLMLTIGSSGFVGHILSGLIVVYSKALRTGEMVKVGDTVGIVSDIGAFSTRLVTARGEAVNIPNSVLVGSTTTNYTRLAGDRGTLLTTTVTIGYDAPWRQVHTMLELAAVRTAGLRSDPKPYVLQRALSDFYVQYELRAHLEQVQGYFSVQSALHGNIQDVFNEHGVQIMSPAYRGDPATPKIVPKEKWFEPPAAR